MGRDRSRGRRGCLAGKVLALEGAAHCGKCGAAMVTNQAKPWLLLALAVAPVLIVPDAR